MQTANGEGLSVPQKPRRKLVHSKNSPRLSKECMHVQSLSHSQLFVTPPDCSLPGSSVHGIFQARLLKWVAISSSRRSSWPRDWTHVSSVFCVSRRIEPRSPTLQADSLPAEPPGKPKNTGVGHPFSSGSSWPRNRTRVSCTAGGFFTTEPSGKLRIL